MSYEFENAGRIRTLFRRSELGTDVHKNSIDLSQRAIGVAEELQGRHLLENPRVYFSRGDSSEPVTRIEGDTSDIRTAAQSILDSKVAGKDFYLSKIAASKNGENCGDWFRNLELIGGNRSTERKDVDSAVQHYLDISGDVPIDEADIDYVLLVNSRGGSESFSSISIALGNLPPKFKVPQTMTERLDQFLGMPPYRTLPFFERLFSLVGESHLMDYTGRDVLIYGGE